MREYNSRIWAIMATVLLLVASCGDTEEQPDRILLEDDGQTSGQSCNYTILTDSTAVWWTAFKYTDKAGVNGQLSDVELSNVEPGSTLEEAMKGVRFMINTNRVNSNDTLRDRKIRQFYFGAMKNGETIEGTVVSVESSATGSTAIVSLKLNDVANDVTMDYEVNGSQITLTASINIEDWNAQAAVAALGEKCSEKHTGEDGTSKLWPDLDIKVIAYYEKDCE